MEDIINKIINELERKIEILNNKSVDLDKKISTPFAFSINFNNERTIATFMLGFIVSELEKLNLSDIIFYNEFDITMDNSLTETEQRDLLEEIEDVTKKESPIKKYIPDNYIYITTKDNKTYHLFIEYKINNKLNYIKLANDFLKFKIYTRNFQENVVFIYVVLKPIDNKKTVTLKNSLGTVEYQILNKIIEKKNIDTDKSVFIFESIDFALNYQTSNLIEESVNRIDESIYRLLELEYDGSYNFEYNDSHYIKMMGKFGPNVISSEYLRRKYIKIRTLHDELLSHKIEIILPDDTYIDIEQFDNSRSINEELFINKLADHFNYQIKKITDEHRKLIVKSEFNYTRRKSFWITILLHKFCNDYQIPTSFFVYDNSPESKDIQESINNLDNIYGLKNPNFSMLCLGLVFYIVKLYNQIMSIDNEIAVYSKEYLSYKKIDSMFDNLKKISKIFNIDFNLKDYHENFINTSFLFLNQLLNKLSKI